MLGHKPVRGVHPLTRDVLGQSGFRSLVADTEDGTGTECSHTLEPSLRTSFRFGVGLVLAESEPPLAPRAGLRWISDALEPACLER